MSFRTLHLWTTACAAALASACAASSPVPPQTDPYFPASLTISPDEKFLFIANANSDLKFGAGSVQVYDLDAVDALAKAWKGGKGPVPAGCTADSTHPELARCPSTVDGQRAGYVGAAAAQIGNFVSAIRAQKLTDGTLRLFTTVRGDPSVTWLDFSPTTGTIDCGGEGDFPRCNDLHHVSAYRNDSNLGILGSEPFSIAIDDAREHVVLTHLSTGNVSLLRAPLDHIEAPTLQDTLTGLWAENSRRFISAVGVAPRKPGDPSDLFYVTSRSEARINVLHAIDTISGDGKRAARLVREDSFFYAPAPAGNGTDGAARGVTFSADGNRAFVANRQPSSLMIFDTSLGARGVPANQLVGEVGLCPHLTVDVLLTGGPDAVAVIETPDGPRVYVTCFDIGEVWVVDVDRARVEATISVGLGPDSLAVPPANLTTPSHNLAFVGNYGDDTISAIDVDPTSPTYLHTVLQLGKLRGEN